MEAIKIKLLVGIFGGVMALVAIAGWFRQQASTETVSQHTAATRQRATSAAVATPDPNYLPK